MTLRLIALVVLEFIVLGACWISGIAVGLALAAHAVFSAVGFAMWLRSGTTTGFAAAMLGVLGPLGLLIALPSGDCSGP